MNVIGEKQWETHIVKSTNDIIKRFNIKPSIIIEVKNTRWVKFQLRWLAFKMRLLMKKWKINVFLKKLFR